MAGKPSSKSLRIRMTIPKKLVSTPVFHTLAKKFKLVHNTLQGRISSKGAWIDVELSGTRRNIDAALEHLQKIGVTVDPLKD